MNHRMNEFLHWFSEEATKIEEPQKFIYEFVKFLNQKGFSIFRLSLGGTALHPEIQAVNYSFTDQILEPTKPPPLTIPYLKKQIHFPYPDGTVTKSFFQVGIHLADVYKNSPIPRLRETKKPIRIPISRIDYDEYPIVTDLREKGAKDYYIILIIESKTNDFFLSYAFREEMKDADIQELRIFSELFGVKWSSFRLREMMSSLLELYIGPMTAPKVLAGKILRGDVEELEAIVWFSDIRGYSSISSQTEPKLLIEWLNDYYESQIRNIHRFGGEVLKIMGDGILAVFPTSQKQKIKTIARRALQAAEKSLEILEKSNQIRRGKGWIPLEHGVALHHGIVQYGNIGSGDRLDFTVIGNDVNLTARLSSLCSAYKEPILFSEEMDSLLPGRLVLAESQVTLKGIPKPQSIFRRKSRSIETSAAYPSV